MVNLGKGTTHPFWVGRQTGAATGDINVKVLQDSKNRSHTWFSYTILENMAKGLYALLQRCLLFHVHYSSIHSYWKWIQPTCPSTGKWIVKIQYIYTIEYYSALKKTKTFILSDLYYIGSKLKSKKTNETVSSFP